MSNASNNTDRANEISSLLAEIEDDTYTDAQLDGLERATKSFTYTSTVLTALADLLSTSDTKAHLMLLRMAGEMAAHEAQTA